MVEFLRGHTLPTGIFHLHAHGRVQNSSCIESTTHWVQTQASALENYSYSLRLSLLLLATISIFRHLWIVTRFFLGLELALVVEVYALPPNLGHWMPHLPSLQLLSQGLLHPSFKFAHSLHLRFPSITFFSNLLSKLL